MKHPWKSTLVWGCGDFRDKTLQQYQAQVRERWVLLKSPMDPYGHLVLNAEGTTQMGVLWQRPCYTSYSSSSWLTNSYSG